MNVSVSWIVFALAVIILIAIFSQFHPASTQQISEGFYAVSCGFVNFYAYKTKEGILLFDTGMNPVMAKRGLEKLGLSPDDVTHIFLTHTDYDHTGGISAFPKAKIFISKDEEQMINGQTARRFIVHNSRLPSYTTLMSDEVVKQGGVSVKLLLTPGHIPGSASYLIDECILATGDLLRITRSGRVKPFLWLMNKDHKRDMQSVNTLESVIAKVEYILTGHTGVYRK